jgi:hypothetical protein
MVIRQIWNNGDTRVLTVILLGFMECPGSGFSNGNYREAISMY